MLSVKPRQACQASQFKMLETNLSQLFAYKPVNPSAMRTEYTTCTGEIHSMPRPFCLSRTRSQRLSFTNTSIKILRLTE